MVAISLYRGNLHRVPDVPRLWLTPVPKISLKDFKTLLNRRNRALSRLRCTYANIALNPNSTSKQLPETPKANGSSLQPQLEDCKLGNCQEEEGKVKNEEIVDQGKLDDGNCLMNPVNDVEVTPEKAVDAVDGYGKQTSEVTEKPAEPPEPANPNAQTSNKVDKVDVLDDKEKRKREIEEKLLTLNGKKHNLVQALKQILHAEEEIKRRNCGMSHPSGPFQVDATNESGLMTRHATPRTGSEANLGGYMEGAETEDASNQNAHSHHMLRMSGMSPCSESPLRRPSYFQHNVVPHPTRASLGVTGSPSRFAPTGHQANSGNLPAVSVSGTNYISSSPSPAASGGTSVFRDARQPSPWN